VSCIVTRNYTHFKSSASRSAVCCAEGSVNNEDVTRGNVLGLFAAEICVSKQHKFYHAYDSIICFEDVKVRFGFGRKSMF